MAGSKVCHICGGVVSNEGFAIDVRFRWPVLFHACRRCAKERNDLSVRAWKCMPRARIVAAALLYVSSIVLFSIPNGAAALWIVKTFEPAKPQYHPAREPFTRSIVVNGKAQEVEILGWTQDSYTTVELNHRVRKYELAILFFGTGLMAAATTLGMRAHAEGRRRALASMGNVSGNTAGR